jgi:hypothetical protein
MDNTPPPSTCSVPDCLKPKFTRGLCSMHYSRLLRHGSVDKTLRQPPQVDVAQKRCPRCAETKPIEEFGRRSNGKPKGYCYACEAAYQALHAATPDGREMRRKARGKWNDDNHGYFLNYRYGITKDDYERMVVEQGGRCAICGGDEPGGRNKLWSVDHCHTSNVVRGLLCSRCNTGLGYFKDDPARLRSAITYLEGGTCPR